MYQAGHRSLSLLLQTSLSVCITGESCLAQVTGSSPPSPPLPSPLTSLVLETVHTGPRIFYMSQYHSSRIKVYIGAGYPRELAL